jgi:hypothetical protein
VIRRVLCLLLALALPSSAFAALTIDSTSTAQTPTDPLSISRTIASGATLDVILCAIDTGAQVISSVIRSSQSYTLLRRDTPASGVTTEIWYRISPASGTANAVVDMAGVTDQIVCYGISFLDSDTSTPFSSHTGACNVGGGSATSSTLTMTAASDEIIIDILAVNGSGHTIVQGADQTEVLDLQEGTSHHGAGSWQLGSVAGGVMSWTWDVLIGDRCQAAAVVNAIGGGGGGGAGVGTMHRRRGQ